MSHITDYDTETNTLTDLLQFIEPLSDWSLHLLLHLSSEQLQPLRGHHLVNTHKHTHLYPEGQWKSSCTEDSIFKKYNFLFKQRAE